MKVLGFVVLLLLTRTCLSQQIRLSGQVLDSEASGSLPGATILLKRDSVQVAGTLSSQDGTFRLPAVPPGIYELQVQLIGYRTKTIRYVAAVSNPAPLLISVPGFCPFTSRGKPVCVGGHSDHLVPIVYGLPSAKTMARAKAGKVYLGGCELTGCDPRYYCSIHKKKL